jgi:CubicO group peptidase (beta-lactamase class C family)
MLISPDLLADCRTASQKILQDGNGSQSSLHIEQAGGPAQCCTCYNEEGNGHGSGREDDGSTIYAIGSLTKCPIALLVTIIIERLSFSEEKKHAGYRTLRREFPKPWATEFTKLFNRFQDTHNQIQDLPRKPSLWHVLVHFNALPPMTHDMLGPDGTSFTSKESFLRAAIRRARTENIQEDRWIYSNGNIVLIGIWIEAMAGEPLERVIEEHLFHPLGMTRTFLGAPSPSVTGIAPPYTMSVDGRRVSAEKMLYGVGDTVNAAFGGYSCCRDLAILFRELLACINDDDYKSIFDRDTIRSYLMRRVTLDNKTEDAFTIFGIRTTLDSSLVGSMSPNRLVSRDICSTYRLGTRKNGKQVPAYYLAGHIEGYSSCYYFIPKYSAFVIVLTNSTAFHDASDHISRLLLQGIFDLEQHRRELTLSKKVDVVDMSSRAAIQGQKLLKKFAAEDSQQDIRDPISIQLDGTYVNEVNESSIIIRPGSLLVNMVGTARNPTNSLVQTQDMGLIRTGDYTIRLRPLSNVGFTLDRCDNYSWGQLNLNLIEDKNTQKVIRLERCFNHNVDKFIRQGD